MDMNEIKRLLVMYDDLRVIAKKLHKLDEAGCNYGLSSRQEKRRNNLIQAASIIAAYMGLAIYHQGDPQEWPLYLVPPDGKNHDCDYCNGVAISPL